MSDNTQTRHRVTITTESPLTWQDVVAVARHSAELILIDSVWEKMKNSRSIVDQIVHRGERAYGITTGLGALCNVVLKDEQLAQLSRNTLMSHACGVGPKLPVEQVRAIMCAAINNFALGYSGINPDLVSVLIEMLNRGITPVVPAQGSVGYLIQMAHIGVTLLGFGDVEWQDQILPASAVFQQTGLKVPPLGAKDGLSFVNGTPCMTGLGCLALADAVNLAEWADVIGAMSFEALLGQMDAFDESVLRLKPYPGIQIVGQHLRQLLAGSQIIAKSQGVRTQDAMSIRSIPQIHGACRDVITQAEQQFNTELASATDNPLIMGTPNHYRIISQSNPHGESIAMTADHLCLAVAELAGVSERRLDRLVNPLVSGLPAFLVRNPGVNSGMMITQYVAASLVSENKILAQPAVVDNYVTSALQEDHLSMGTTAVQKLLKIIENSTQVLAIEYLLAAQAFEFFDQQELATGTRAAWLLLRAQIPAYDEDRWLAPDVCAVSKIVRNTYCFNMEN